MVAFFFLVGVGFAAPLKVNYYINSLIKSDNEFQSLLTENLKVKYLLDQALPSQSLVLAVTNEYGLISKGAGSTTSSLETSVTKDFVELGTSFSYTRRENRLADRQEELNQFRLSQSLWRNSFGYRNRKIKSSTLKRKELLKLQVIESYEDYVFTKLNDFLDYFLSFQKKEVLRKQLIESYKMRDDVLAKRKAGISLDLDVNRTLLEVNQIKINAVNAKRDFDSRKKSLLIFIDQASLLDRPTLQGSVFLENYNVNLLKENFFSHGRSIRIAKLDHQASVENLQAKKNDYSPDLNLVLGYNMDESSRFGVTVNREETVIGLSLSIPINDNQLRAGRAQASYEEKKKYYAFKLVSQSKESNIRFLQEKLKFSKELMDLSEQRKEIADKIKKAEGKRFARGRIDLNVLIQARQTFFQAQLNYQEARITYYKDLLQYLNETDSLIEPFNQLL